MQKIDEEKEKLTGRNEKNDLGETKKKKKKKGKHKRRKNKRDTVSKDKAEIKDNKRSALSNDQFIINGNLNLIKMLGFGAFGEIHLAYDTNTKQLRAIKFEIANHKNPQLKHEHSILEQLNKPETNIVVSPEGFPGIPRVYLFDRMENKYNYMVMDFLGPSLSDLFLFKEKSFSIETVLMMGIQMITRIEFIHEKGFIHRDIKPENFVIGLNDKSNLVHIIDFGLSKRFKDKNTGQHIPYRENRHLVGTVRYASINAHIGIEQSRRDDIESIGYVLAYFYLGRLPWQSKMDKGKSPLNRIMEKKLITPPEILCKRMPIEFAYYFHYCKNLKFEDRPDYTTIKCLFADLLATKIDPETEFLFDWFDDDDENKNSKNNKKNNKGNNEKGSDIKPIYNRKSTNISKISNKKGVAPEINEEEDSQSMDNNNKGNNDYVTPGNNNEPVSLFSQTKKEGEAIKNKQQQRNNSFEGNSKYDSNFAEDFLNKIGKNEEKKKDDNKPKPEYNVIQLKAIKVNNTKRSFSESESDEENSQQDNNKEEKNSTGSNFGILKSSNSSEKKGDNNEDIILEPKNDDVKLNVFNSKK